MPALRYRLRSAPYLVTEVDQITGEVTEHAATCAVADWLGEEPGDGRAVARDLLVPAMSRDDDPKAWLRNYLTDAGETLRQTIMAAGQDADFSSKQLQRAAQALRVVYRDSTVDPPNSTRLRQVTWRLPDRRSGGDCGGDNPSMTVPTVPTEALGRVLLSSSSQVRGGEDGEDGHSRVEKSVLTDPVTGTTAEWSLRDDDCPDCGRGLDDDPATACAYRLHHQGVLP